MTHAVKVFNNKGLCTYEEHFRTAEQAYEKYQEYIRILKKHSRKGEEVTIARFNEGAVMTLETIAGTQA